MPSSKSSRYFVIVFRFHTGSIRSVDAVKGAMYIGLGMFFGNIVGDLIVGIVKAGLSAQ